ncbi:FAD:protein FMN transferase [Atopobacter phocae]|uniref:FAD:protein FMN transferase n=1 Tax=Atopobacter phocae TaxID=136492 RepID=UPI00046F015E|nr:FAD:protein FMN transferase [Atopobacter phocae]
MNKIFKYKSRWFLCLLSLMIFIGCTNQSTQTKELAVSKTPLTETETYLDTVVQLKIYHDGQEKVMEEAFDLVRHFDDIWSPNGTKSEVKQINQAAGDHPVKVSKDTIDVLLDGQPYEEKSQGYFDLTVDPIVRLWQIGTDQARVPEESEIKAALPLIDYQQIEIKPDEQTVYLPQKGMGVQIGSIAKGYIADRLKELFESKGITTAIINLGGNVVVMGQSPSREDGWNVGVQDPDETRGEVVGSVIIKDSSIVTSGIYERFFEQDGKMYHHILNPKTGYPVDNDISGVSVFTKESVDGDALSTTLFALGVKDGLALIESLDEVEAVFVLKDHRVITSSGLEGRFQLTNDQYKMETINAYRGN